MPQMIPVQSSNIDSVGYDPTTEMLTVRFASGRTYVVEAFPPGAYDDFMSAGSKGSFYANEIRNQYKVVPA